MAEDNPFLGFFESMGVGMEAGAKRRSLMERAQQGKLEPGETVPSLGRTILQGITKAATPASTRLAQEELKLRAANQALDYKIQQDRQKALDAKAYYDKSKEAAEAEAEKDNSILFSDLTYKAQSAISLGKFGEIPELRKQAKGLPVPQQVQFNAVLNDLNDTYDAEEFIKFDRNKKYLSNSLPAEELNALTPPEAQRLVEVYFGKPISNIGAMVSDYDTYRARGAEGSAQLVLASIKKNTETKGQVVEVSPEGNVTIREEILSGSKPELSKQEESDRAEAIEASEKLFSTIDQARSLVASNPNLVGSTGEISGGLNALKEVLRPLVDLPQNATRIQIENAFNTLKTEALTSLGGGSLARLTDKDAKILENNIPQLSLTDSPGKVMSVLNQLEGTISLRYLLNRSRTNTLSSLVSDLGAARVGKLAATAGRLNFRPGLVDEAIREAISSIDAQTDTNVARQQILDLFTALQDNGFSDAQREPYIRYLETLSETE